MVYRVELTQRAEREMQNLYERISAEDSAASANWFSGLEDAISSLERLPHRCPIAPESKIWGRLLRHLLYGATGNIYPVIYEIDEAHNLVRIRTIRHGAMESSLRTVDIAVSTLAGALPALLKSGYQSPRERTI